MSFYTDQSQCTYTVPKRTPHETNPAGETHIQTRLRRVRGEREIEMSTRAVVIKLQVNITTAAHISTQK